MTDTDTPVTHAVITKTSGWVVFSGVVIVVAAAANLMYAITVLAKPDWVVLAPESIIRFDLTTAGWILLVFALFQFFVAFGVFHGALWARVLGIIGAGLSILTQMAFLSVYPAWSWLILVVDALIIYGLTVHGDEVAEL